MQDTVEWAAGLFEGEGYASIRANRWVSLGLSMTDKDIVERFAAVMGTGTIREQQIHSGLGSKTQWRWAIARTDEVRRIAEMFLPFMGVRRSARLHECLALIDARVPYTTERRRAAGLARWARASKAERAAVGRCMTEARLRHRNSS